MESTSLSCQEQPLMCSTSSPLKKNHLLLFLPRHPPPERRQRWCRYFPIMSAQGGGGVGGVPGWCFPRRICSRSTCRGRYEAYAAMTAGQRRSCSRRPSRCTNGDASPPNARPLASSRRRSSSSSGLRRFGHLNCVFCSSILNKMLSEHQKNSRVSSQSSKVYWIDAEKWCDPSQSRRSKWGRPSYTEPN
jgi:hypothetical protein